MITDGIRQADKAKLFDWLVNKLEDGTVEMLFKEDDTGDMDYDSVSNFAALLDQLETEALKPKRKPSKYVNLTLVEFKRIREEIYSSYSQSGCMDEDAMICAEKAYDAIKKAEKRNDVPPLV